MNKYVIMIVSVLLGAAMASACLGQHPTESSKYETAKAQCEKDGKPFVVVIYADWCPPCKRLHAELLASKDTSFRWVRVEYSSELGKQLMKEAGTSGQGIPQVFVWKYSDREWMGVTHVGYLSQFKLRQLIRSLGTKQLLKQIGAH